MCVSGGSARFIIVSTLSILQSIWLSSVWLPLFQLPTSSSARSAACTALAASKAAVLRSASCCAASWALCSAYISAQGRFMLGLGLCAGLGPATLSLPCWLAPGQLGVEGVWEEGCTLSGRLRRN